MESTRKILLVEDSRVQALKLVDVLEGAGWQVIHAESAEKAIEVLERDTPDLILIDFYLPGIRGDAFCRQIRKRIDTRTVPIVILTSDAVVDVELRGLESGADDFISKSADPSVLIVRLRALLEKASTHGAADEGTLPERPGGRLLAIDDSLTYLAFLTTQLQESGYQVETAQSGRAALARLQDEDFDCILVDLVMPDMDGIEVCARVNELRKRGDRSFMILMLTALEDNQNLARAFEAGADDFVGKSSDIVVVKGRLRALLRRKSYEDEHRARLSAELRAKEIENTHAVERQQAAEARAALVDGLEQAASALRRSNEELQQFAYVASHDLQEPLRMVASYVQLLERRYKEKLDDEAREFIAYVVEGVVRMKNMINDLLAYSRVANREAPAEPIPADEALDDAMKNLEVAIEESGAEISREPLPALLMDHGQLAQLFQNLIGNAIKYRGEKTPSIRISSRREGSECVISVSDNGIGIEQDYYDRIFVIFQRLHTREQYAGTGIGLAICKKIVARYGGRIWVESKPGQGSTFNFSIPGTGGLVHELETCAAH